MKRFPHFMSHNKGGEYPREVIVVDTETREVPQPDGSVGHVLEFGWAAYARRKQGDKFGPLHWHRFTTRAEFWRWALRHVRNKGKLTMYAHNLEFDAQVLDAFGELARRKWKVIAACLEGPPTIIKWRRGKRTLQFLDTLNLWRMPLKELGRHVGLEKLDLPPDWSDTDLGDIYCRRDVEILWAALLAWWEFLVRHDLGTAAATLAGQAMNAFRHRFLTAPIYVDCNPQALELARAAYLGGRCEAFKLGVIDEPVNVLDFNSMYLAVMRDLWTPTRLLTVRGEITAAKLRDYAEKYCVVARVDLDTWVPMYPHVIDHRLCFPVGRFTQCLATPELVRALDAGHVKHVHRVAIYERAQLFRAFALWIWGMRAAAQVRCDLVEDWMLKNLGNSLYGKFGQRGRVWEVIGEADDFKITSDLVLNADTRQWIHTRQVGTSLQELRTDTESANSHPAIAAHVTSAARLKIWDTMQEAGPGNVFYTDTDSIHCNAAGMALLGPYIDAGALGALKLEAEGQYAEYRGVKDYSIGFKDKSKGVKAKAVEIAPGEYTQDQWQGWAGAIRAGRVDLPVTRQVVKRLTRVYHKGYVTASGWVEPLYLSGDQDRDE